ncbi:hypothetical protein TRFO_18913 [Tritrichomonas foetus]|uniref:Uncharacterized protein n=1 Tax=Tritrichomonas foetus TaxID=1144522 RepID=A0A1J4KKU7_9EUKA|nr:hypothetical protein TRFO_18913 [Tritrichomonas foetus]|eukprot:OHT11560.1 hypothetical protein TRFO_18913 [Tritrichomonas foetus]
MVNAEIKKINRAIRRIKDPKPISAREPAAESPRSEKSEKEVEPKESENQQPGYAELQKVRNGQNHGEKQEKQEKPLSPVTRKVAASPTPKKSKLPARRKTNEPDTPSAGIQATAAGAKFFADLMNDDDDPPF